MPIQNNQGIDFKTMAPKLLQMGYKPKDILTAFETASKLGLIATPPTPAEKIANQKAEADALETKNQNELKLNQFQMKADELGSAKNDPGLSSSVGPDGPWGLYALFNRTDPIGSIIGSSRRGDFIAGVKQLTDQETIATLLNLKQAGGTLGALSDSERKMLQDAATKINFWAIKDGDNITGYNTTEESFKKELTKLQTLAQTAADRARGAIQPTQTPEVTPQVAPQSGASFEGLQQWIQANPNNPKAQKAAQMINNGQLTAESFGGMIAPKNNPAPVENQAGDINALRSKYGY